MSFKLNDVRQSSTIGQDLFGPSRGLAHEIDISSKHRVETIDKQVRTRDVIMKGLPVLTEAQLRAGEDIAPIAAMEKVVGETLGKSMQSKRKLAANNKSLQQNEHLMNESKPVRLVQSKPGKERPNSKRNDKDAHRAVSYGPAVRSH
jgi:hypothetical protein